MADPTREFTEQFSLFVRQQLHAIPLLKTKGVIVNLHRDLEKFISGKDSRAADFLFFVRHQCSFEDEPIRFGVASLDDRQLAEHLLRQIRRTINLPSYQHQSQIANKRTRPAKTGGGDSKAKTSSRKRIAK